MNASSVGAVTAAVAVGILLLPSALPAQAALGSPFGARVQIVAPEGRTVDVVTANCVGQCILTWESFGASRLTLRCLDDGETSVSIFPQLPQLTHPCIVESTLEIWQATESIVVWRANACTDPVCTPWP